MRVNPLNDGNTYTITEARKRLIDSTLDIEVGGSLQARIFSRGHPAHFKQVTMSHDYDLTGAAAIRCSQATRNSVKPYLNTRCSLPNTPEARTYPELP